VDLQLVPSPTEYQTKVLTQLNAGDAPSIIVASDDFAGRVVQTGALAELNEFIEAPRSPVAVGDFYDNLWGAARAEDGSIFGVPVGCNPLVFWYNRRVLRDAGVSEMPADLYERGEWNRDAFDDMVRRVSENDRRGFVVGNSWAIPASWAITNGGSVYADGRFVMHEDDRSVEAIEYISQNLRDERFEYAGALPEGQGEDALFLSDQLAFVAGGRYYAPLFQQSENLEADIVPWPANTGERVEPAAVFIGFYVMPKEAQNAQAAATYMLETASAEGQRVILSDGAGVPSIKGIDEVVADSEFPDHSQYFNEARDEGFVLFEEEAKVPGLTAEIVEMYDSFFTGGGGDARRFLRELAEMVNGRLEESAG